MRAVGDKLRQTSIISYILAPFRLTGKPFYFLFLAGTISVLVASALVRKLTVATKTSITKRLPRLPSIKVRKPTIARFTPSTLAHVLALIVLVTSLSLVSFFFFWAAMLKDLPPADALSSRTLEISTKIYDRDGNLLYQLYKDKNRTLVRLDEIPIQVRLATLAAEDANFYNHRGISAKGILRATYKLATEGKVTGGSTITQQLVKNALLSSDKTLARKAKELAIAIVVEQHYTKDEILEMYLNEVSYGGTAYGIQEAARHYFNKDVSELSLAEAAFLAGLPKSPSVLSPFSGSPGLALGRRREVLRLMEENGFITHEQSRRAMDEELVFANNKTNIFAPHFVMFVRQQLSGLFEDEFIYGAGLEVHTTLDSEIQKVSENAVVEELSRLVALNVGNGAALVVNPKTGAILAMVGSRNYFDIEREGNVNVVLSKRPPGSAIKIINYANALSRDFTPASVVDDSPSAFHISGQPPYIPRNYDGEFRGKITLRSALAESRNVPAVKILNQLGVDSMLDMGRKMGITSWTDSSRFGLSLTLGGGEVSLYELATVYSTVANYGKRPTLYAIEKIIDREGAVLFENRQSAEQVLDSRVAFMLTDILKDNDARAPAFGRHSTLVIPGHREVAVKTGTSNDLRDNHTIGYTQEYLAAVWVGNNDNSPMSRVASGITGASAIWNKIMTSVVATSTGNTTWPVPAGLVALNSCGRREWYLAENQSYPPCEPATGHLSQIREQERLLGEGAN